MLKIGDKAPLFRGIDQAGREVDLEALLAKGPVVVYFYPRDFTPVCTRQACHFRDAYEDLTGRGVEVVGVSADSVESHKDFAERHKLPFSIISDPNRTVARDYQALNLLGLGAKRVSYVIDRDATIQGVIHHELRAKRHVDDLDAILAKLH
jgi:peroxiredoxin Q/BCP